MTTSRQTVYLAQVPTPRLLSTAEVAALANRSPRTIARWAEQGKLPIIRQLPGTKGAFLFDGDTIEAAIAQVKR